ncbi:MAG: DUF3574 domain-containing protein [Bacilli bacterium]|nr:DUF3574 domain-containing protein [Bacilli bacterium]
MKKPWIIVLCALAVLSVGLSGSALGVSIYSLNNPSSSSTTPASEQQLNEYIMYVGTNDKDTYQLEMPLEDARNIVQNKLMDHFPDGFTMYDAKGVWRDENKVITLEYSFVCVIETTEKAEVYKVADELIVALNQSTILIVTNAVQSIDFYMGAK